MRSLNHLPRARRLGPILGGPALIGLCLAARAPYDLTEVWALPTIFVGVTVLMLPALYIGASLIGVAPGAQTIGTSAVTALSRMGLVLAGLAPAVLFLIVSETAGPRTIGYGAVVVATFVGLVQLRQMAFGDSEAGLRGPMLSAVWSIVTVGIGAHFLSLLAGA